jgi:hypothetical protein
MSLTRATFPTHRTHLELISLLPFGGRAIAQAVSLWLPTAAAQVPGRIWSSGICGEESGAGASFLRVLRFPMPIFIPPNAPSSITRRR